MSKKKVKQILTLTTVCHRLQKLSKNLYSIFNEDITCNYFKSFTMYYILLIALIQKTVLTYLRFSPLNSLSKNLLNWSFPAGSWSNSSILNAHRFTLRCGISRGFLNILHWKSCIGLYYIAILFHTTIITCTCKLIIKSDSRTLHTIFFPEFFSSFKFIKQKHILLHSMVANCSKDNIIVRMH